MARDDGRRASTKPALTSDHTSDQQQPDLRAACPCGFTGDWHGGATCPSCGASPLPYTLDQLRAALPAFNRAVRAMGECWDALAEVETALGQDFENLTSAIGDLLPQADSPDSDLEEFAGFIASLELDGPPHADQDDTTNR